MKQDSDISGPFRSDSFRRIAGRLRGLSVLAVGDVMLDRFVDGGVYRLSPEAPVPVLKAGSEARMAGGVGNVTANLRGLGVEPRVIALIGNDAEGETLRGIVTAQGAAADLIADPARPTTVKTRFTAGGQHLLRVDRESDAPAPAAVEDLILSRASALMAGTRLLILSDYRKGILTPRVAAGLIDMARAAGLPVLVDPKGRDYGLYRDAGVVTPNLKELADATGMAVDTEDAIEKAALGLIRSHGIGAVIVTRAERGVTVVRDGWDTLHYPAEARHVRDVSGVGDTLVAGVAAALAAGADIATAAAIGNSAAAIAVEKPGTALVSLAELGERLAPDGVEDAPARVAEWKRRGLKVGFTNGCFDILHPGHVGYLAAAKSHCDRLVVGLNGDASVRRLKGPSRPVNDQAARAAVLEGLRSVDLVAVFGNDPAEDDKPICLIDRLRPDIIFKGGDYTEDQLPEAKAVRAYGGEVRIMPLHEGHSTTGTIARARSGGEL